MGHKTVNVVMANIFNEPSFAVDTHVTRVSIRLGLAKENDNVLIIEKKLNKYFSKKDWNRLNDQFIWFGRYICKAQRPLCNDCPFNGLCKITKKH